MNVKAPDGTVYQRVFIPAKLEDNKILMENDPTYGSRVLEVGDPVLGRALREGNWDLVAGAAFPEWDKHIHVIPTEVLPAGRPVYRALDWGYQTPYGGLWGFFDDDMNLVIGREIYGWSGKVNVGTKEEPEAVRSKIEMLESSQMVNVREAFLDPQAWEERSGLPSIAARLGGRAMGWKPWPKGPNSRINQLQSIHQLMAVTNGRSRLKVMDCCRHFIRTVPSLPMDTKNPEDIDTHTEDHLYDAFRGLVATKCPSTADIIRLRQYDYMRERQDRVVGYDLGGW